MRVLIFGDVFGRPGRRALCAQLSDLRLHYQADFVVVNAENAAGGVGLTRTIADELFGAGADCLTLGNHCWDQAEMRRHIEREDRIIRPTNLPDGEPGKGVKDFYVGSVRISVIQAMGTVFMQPGLSNPFTAVDALVADGRTIGDGQITLVDFHGEATSEKIAMAHHLDGRVSSVTGTHTHIPTADTRIFPGGTAYQTDLGMCGDYHSVIGSQAEGVIPYYLGERPNMRFSVAMGEPTLCGILLSIDDTTGQTQSADPIRVGGVLRQAR